MEVLFIIIVIALLVYGRISLKIEEDRILNERKNIKEQIREVKKNINECEIKIEHSDNEIEREGYKKLIWHHKHNLTILEGRLND